MELLFLFIEWLSMVAYQGLRDLYEVTAATFVLALVIAYVVINRGNSDNLE